MASSADFALPPSSAEQALSLCELTCRAIHTTLAETSEFILHRSQWQCLALSYTEVLQVLRRFFPQATRAVPVSALRVLHDVMLDAERFMCHCTATQPVEHSWLLSRALKHGAATDVMDIHLDRFLWAFSTTLIGAAPNLPKDDQLKSDLILLRVALVQIWDGEHAKKDLLSVRRFLAAIECKEDRNTSLLVEFIQSKLSHYLQESVSGPSHDLPAYLWINPESVQKSHEVVGSGSYGDVQKAEWLGGRFAVKDFFYVEDSEVFGREAVIQARLRHPTLLPLMCCTKIPSLCKCSLVMELMEKDLRVLMLDRKNSEIDPPFSLFVALELMLQIAQAMEHLHSLHIMHRDLKSSNVLVSFPRENSKLCPSFVHLKVADFGMSKAKMASTKYTTKPLGSAEWRAPELFIQDPEANNFAVIKYTKKADVYSFGLVCYEILTGNLPFEGPYICKRVLQGDRPALPSTCPRALSSLIESCWNAEPSKRPTFTQICSVLRYLMSAVLLQNSAWDSSAHSHCLLQPVGFEFCNDIDGEFKKLESFMHHGGTVPPPRSVNIPLRMYCCEIVLQQSAQGDTTLNGQVHSKTHHPSTKKTTSSLTSNPQQWHGESGHKWLCFSCIRKRWRDKSTESDAQDSLDLSRSFSFETLKSATQNFSRKIGEGSSAIVFYGKLEDGREVAVKVFRDYERWRAGANVLQELKIASRFRHRNIVPLLGWCQTRSALHLVYEYMAYGDLASHLCGGETRSFILNWQQRVRICRQVASALTYLHQDSGDLVIVHRDVKPGNVLLDSDLNARLRNSGLERSLLRHEGSISDEQCGTMGYVPPETVSDNIFCPAGDVYAFGIIILQLLSGERDPFKARKLFQAGHDPVAAADQRLRGEFPEAEFKEMLSLAAACVREDPGDRPRTQALAEIISGISQPPECSTFPASPEWSASSRSPECIRTIPSELDYSSGEEPSPR